MTCWDTVVVEIVGLSLSDPIAESSDNGGGEESLDMF